MSRLPSFSHSLSQTIKIEKILDRKAKVKQLDEALGIFLFFGILKMRGYLFMTDKKKVHPNKEK